MRTSSDRDVVYRDRFQPYCTTSSLLVYGTERFVAGGNSEPVLRVFDFRYPKPYLHFNALPCSDQPPCPEAPEVAHSRLSRQERQDSAASLDQEPSMTFSMGRCEPGRGDVCRWHGQSRHPDWRPDATVFLGTDADDRVFSLAKASDLSGSFYCGMRGAIVEATSILAEDILPKLAARPPAPPGWVARDDEQAPRRMALLETGTSRCDRDWWVGIERMRGMALYRHHPKTSFDSYDSQPEMSRLDASLRPQ